MLRILGFVPDTEGVYTMIIAFAIRYGWESSVNIL